MATIATHNGSNVAIEHNRRDRRITDKEEHIDPNGISENWVDCESVEKAYERVFGKAIEEYNAKQIRNRHHDKQTSVQQFLGEIEQHKYKKPMYEMIVGVYGEDVSEQQKKEILWDFAQGWKERNPNLIMVGCYYHSDEPGEQHLHIDYIPIYHANQRGIGIKQGLNKALEEQGIEEPSESKGRFDKFHTRQIEWEKRENAHLEQLCQAKGISVQHSEFSREHEEKRDYIARQQMQENRELKQDVQELQKQNQAYEKREERYKGKIGEIVQAYNKMIDENKKLSQKVEELDRELHYHPIDKYTAKENEWASDWDLQR